MNHYRKFPENFLWGTATSPTQIEGNIDNEWTSFVARDGGTCAIACDSYHKYPEDVSWMRSLGVNAYRMGIEWSRLQKEPGAPLDQTELARYLDQLERLQAAGVSPMVVLHHFSNPPWINSSGGWTNRHTVRAFVDYVKLLAPRLRNHVQMWNTFNEPDTYACCGFVIGEFPPQFKGRLDRFRRVVRHMAEAHEQACHVIRAAGSSLGPVEVGFSKNWACFEPHSRYSPWDSILALVARSYFNEFVLKCFLQGERSGASTYLGVNYYGRIRFNHLRPLVPAFGYSRDRLSAMGVECDEMLERHPAGLELALLRLQRQTRLPIYLTEHGSSSSDELFRARDLFANLHALHSAIAQGVNVRGFYYWSLLDNFEWNFGYTKKFGLLSVDFSNPSRPRQMKHLGEVYRRICFENAVPARLNGSK